MSENPLYKYIPEYVPRPHATGQYKSSPDTHFFLAEFVDMVDSQSVSERPTPKAYMAAVATLHDRSLGKSPDGKFGFAVNTRFGNVEQFNGWKSSWEDFFTSQMRQFLDREERVRGEHNLESLVSGDLWPGNVSYKVGKESISVYDASAVWGHNEGESQSLYLMLNGIVLMKSTS